jgi:hypothetical protein
LIVERIQGIISIRNISSEKVHIKTGFEKEGMLRRFPLGKGIADVHLYAIIKYKYAIQWILWCKKRNLFCKTSPTSRAGRKGRVLPPPDPADTWAALKDGETVSAFLSLHKSTRYFFAIAMTFLAFGKF